MKDKERIEMVRLKERTGGYHKYVDSAFIHNPDPQSNHYISGKPTKINCVKRLYICVESDRFDKDFAVADQKVRQQKFE